jgi:hypothetical protein
MTMERRVHGQASVASAVADVTERRRSQFVKDVRCLWPIMIIVTYGSDRSWSVYDATHPHMPP